MTRAAYEQLLALLRHAVNDNPQDDQIRRLSKGLMKALSRWLRLTEPTPAQARNGAPRATSRLAVVNASLGSLPQETSDGTTTRTQGKD